MSLEFESPSELRETPPITYSLPLYDKFIINDSHRDQFVISLLAEDSQNKQAAFLTESYDNKPETVNQAVAHLTEILVTAGKKTFKLRRQRQRRHISQQKNSKKKDWFDDECRETRSSMRKLRRQLTSNPFSLNTQQRYLGKCREYKRLLKAKQGAAKAKLTSRLLQLANENPKSFWKTLKEINRQNDSDTPSSENILATEWHSHFLREVKMMLPKLKNNKAASDDLIANEMLRYAASAILPSLTKLFNLVLETGHFPQNWNISCHCTKRAILWTAITTGELVSQAA